MVFIRNQGVIMIDRHAASYVPLSTERNKQVVKDLRPGTREKIDVVNASDPKDRMEVEAWIVADEDGPVHFMYQDGASGHEVEFGFADEVRELIAEAETDL
jgi:hypothetical protein